MEKLETYDLLVKLNQHNALWAAPTEISVDFWYERLKDYPRDVVEAVILQHYARSDDKPTPAAVGLLTRNELDRRASKQRALAGSVPAPDLHYGQLKRRMLQTPENQAIMQRERQARAEHFGEPTDAEGNYVDPPGWHPSSQRFH